MILVLTKQMTLVPGAVTTWTGNSSQAKYVVMQTCLRTLYHLVTDLVHLRELFATLVHPPPPSAASRHNLRTRPRDSASEQTRPRG